MTRLLIGLLAAVVVLVALWAVAVNRVPAVALIAVIAEGALLGAWDRLRAALRIK